MANIMNIIVAFPVVKKLPDVLKGKNSIIKIKKIGIVFLKKFSEKRSFDK